MRVLYVPASAYASVVLCSCILCLQDEDRNWEITYRRASLLRSHALYEVLLKLNMHVALVVCKHHLQADNDIHVSSLSLSPLIESFHSVHSGAVCLWSCFKICKGWLQKEAK